MTHKNSTTAEFFRSSRLGRALVWLVSASLVGTPVIMPAQVFAATLPARVDMNLGPITAQEEASNIVLDLSVEFPTVGAAYRTDFNPATTYEGYWDPKGCYKYKDPTTGAPLGGEYFYRSNSVDATGYCNRGSATGEYSGNLLNYAASSAIDILRLGLTGGNREEDTATNTILARAYLFNKWNLNQPYFPAHRIPQGSLGKHMPPAPTGTTVTGGFVYSGSCKNLLWFGTSATSDVPCEVAKYVVKFGGYFGTATGYTSGNDNPMTSATTWKRWDWSANNMFTDDAAWCTNSGISAATPKARPGDNRTGNKDYFTSCTISTNTSDPNSANRNLNPPNTDSTTNKYRPYLPFVARVKVCDATDVTGRTAGANTLCQQYPSGNYKPVGQIQKKSDGAKIGVFAYLANGGGNSTSPTYYGGVMRAPLAFVGPTKRDSAGNTINNTNTEWDGYTGVFNAQPRGTTLAGANKSTYPKNGAINYLNGFGTLNPNNLGYYKEFDTFNGLYFESLRYYMGETAAEQTAYANATDTDAENFPYYHTWTDPMTSSCQRKNFVLAIGDVNTHGVAQIENKDIAGKSTSTWTGIVRDFEAATDASFTGPDGKSVNTQGNPNSRTIADNRRLDMAGAAYAANAQRFRSNPIPALPVGASSSAISAATAAAAAMRVKTFAIDVDEGGDGTLLDTSPRAVKARSSSLYLMGKYGWFNNTTLDANKNPDNHIFTVDNPNAAPYSNAKWENKAAANTPDGYVMASQADRMLEGITKFFNSINSERASIYNSAMSSTTFSKLSPDGAVYIPSFDAKDWSGTVKKRALTFSVIEDAEGKPTGSKLEMGAEVWDAGKILTAASRLDANTAATGAQVKPANRKIFTYTRDLSGQQGGKDFTAANLSKFDTAVQTALQNDWSAGTATPTVRNAAYAQKVIDWVRGDRSVEKDGSDPNRVLRARSSVMGDVINSGPVYKKGANMNISGKDYATFVANQAGRAAVVYTGANDGMLHAFRADNSGRKDASNNPIQDAGQELFAYIPRAVAPNLSRLASPAYLHLPFVDGVPTVDEVQFTASDGTQSWKTVLASGMGGGAKGVFALDVTDPENFSANNVLFEFTSADDTDMGNVLGAPKLVKIRTNTAGAPVYKWFVAVSSGFNNFAAGGYSTAAEAQKTNEGKQYLFLLSVDKRAGSAWVQNTDYFKFEVGESSGLSNPATVTGYYGDAQLFYAGDTAGNLWKFDLSSGLGDWNAVKQAAVVKKKGSTPVPLAIARDSSASTARQPITTTPLVVPAANYGYMVVFGTGKFMESGDPGNSSEQGVYGVWDNLSNDANTYEVDRSKLFARPVDTATGLSQSNDGFSFGDGTGTGANRTYRGWYMKLPESGERIIVEGTTDGSRVVFNSVIPGAGECSAEGRSNQYGINANSGILQTAVVKYDTYVGRPSINTFFLGNYAYGKRGITGDRSIEGTETGTSTTTAKGNLTSNSQPDFFSKAGRVSWRQIKNFN